MYLHRVSKSHNFWNATSIEQIKVAYFYTQLIIIAGYSFP